MANGADGASVNTGYMLKPTSRIEVDFQFTDAPKDVLFGAWGDTKSDAVPQLRAAFWVYSGTFRFILSDTRFDSRDTTVLIDTARHVAVIDVLNHKCWLQDVNGELQGVKIDFPACSNVSDWPISLFAGSKNAAGDGKVIGWVARCLLDRSRETVALPLHHAPGAWRQACRSVEGVREVGGCAESCCSGDGGDRLP